MSTCKLNKLCVFCGSHHGSRPVYRSAAEALGNELVSRNIGLVYGGGNVGLMGRVADTVMKGGGEVIGVIPGALENKELAHYELTELRVVNTMHERKALMAELSDGFITLPGGIGTLEEFCEILTWAQLGIHGKPCGLLNIEGFYDRLLEHFEQMLADGFFKSKHRELLLVDSDPGKLIDQMSQWESPRLTQWLTPAEE